MLPKAAAFVDDIQTSHLLLFQAVLEENHDGGLASLAVVAVLQERDEPVGVRALAHEELQVADLRQDFLDGLGELRLSLGDLAVGHVDLLPLLLQGFGVGLQVGLEVALREPGLDEPLVQDQVQAGLDHFLGPFVSVLGRRIRAVDVNVTMLSGDEPAFDFVEALVDDLVLGGVGEHLVPGDQILENNHF